MPRAFSSGALSISSKATALAMPASARTCGGHDQSKGAPGGWRVVAACSATCYCLQEILSEPKRRSQWHIGPTACRRLGLRVPWRAPTSPDRQAYSAERLPSHPQLSSTEIIAPCKAPQSRLSCRDPRAQWFQPVWAKKACCKGQQCLHRRLLEPRFVLHPPMCFGGARLCCRHAALMNHPLVHGSRTHRQETVEAVAGIAPPPPLAPSPVLHSRRQLTFKCGLDRVLMS